MQSFKFIGIFCALLCSLATAVSTAYGQVIISEVYPAPGVGESEWIELYNASDEAVELTGFVLFDQLSSPSLLHTFADQSIDPLQYLLIDLNSSKLNNAGDGVELRQADGTVLDLVNYSSGQPARSWQRLSLFNAELVLTDPTPEAVNLDYPLLGNEATTPAPTSSPTLTPTPMPSTSPSPNVAANPDVSSVSLIAIAACPIEGKESLTLSNDGEDLVIDSWQVIDAAGNQKLISGLLPAGEATTFDWTGSLLNNSGDSLELVTGGGMVVATAKYDTCIKGIPLIKQGDTWKSKISTPQPTETSQNKLVVSPAPVADIPVETDETQSLPALAPDVLGVASSAAVLDRSIGAQAGQIQLAAPMMPSATHPPPNLPQLAKPPIWPAYNVIIGGLLQILPSGILLYEKSKLISLPQPIFA